MGRKEEPILIIQAYSPRTRVDPGETEKEEWLSEAIEKELLRRII